QLLNTLNLGKILQPTYSMRANYHYYRELHPVYQWANPDLDQLKWHGYHIFHCGVRGNLKINIQRFFIMLEGGMEYTPTADSRDKFVPVFGLGLGIQ
ncbi:MAG: hypothetical protein U1B83_05115, partial [Candidatus Cloacimonadaceae bacterium]|nr:hypothetical protein [Candidatus Cloacimonadaceae bacterium]